MGYTKLPIAIVGQDAERSALKLSAQTTVNFYPDRIDGGGVSDVALSPTPGLRLMGEAVAGEVRGFVQHSDTLYAVCGDRFVEITIDGNGDASFTTRGTIDTLSGPISMDVNNTQILICGGGTDTGYTYTPSGTSFATIGDVDFPGAIDVVTIDGIAFTIAQNSQTINASAVGDMTSWDALDFIEADFKNDNLVGLAALNGELWAFGKTTIQVYYNSANASGFPFSQRTNAKVDFGCAAQYSICNYNNGLIFLDSRGYVTYIEGYKEQIVSTSTVNKAISEYATTSDALGFAYSDRGRQFYQLTFPSADVTWVYDIQTNAWHRRTSVRNGVERHHLAQAYIRFDNRHIVGAYDVGRVYEIDPDLNEEDGSPIFRERTSQHSVADMEMLYIDNIELFVDVHNVPLEGQGSNPQIMFQYSKDGGDTWSNELWRDLPQPGDQRKRVVWHRLGRSRLWTFKFRVSDPVGITIIGAYANARISGTPPRR